MSARCEFGTMPPARELDLWREWLRHHCIDPGEVAVPGWIERDEASRQVRYEAYQFDGPRRPRLSEDGDILREVHVIQLEAVPSPFPGGAA
jgi:hypothetical protein